MNTNYDSARTVLALAMESCHIDPCTRVEDLLPTDARYTICTPARLTAALGLVGIDATLYEIPALGPIARSAFKHGYLVICLAGAHSVEEQRCWIIGFRQMDGIADFVGGGFEAPLDLCNPVHIMPLIIVVRGRKDEHLSHYPEEDL